MNLIRRFLRLLGIRRKYPKMILSGKGDPRLTSVMTAEMLEEMKKAIEGK